MPQVETFLPVQRRSALLPASETAVASPPIATPPSRGTILIVDDSSANLKVFRCTLSLSASRSSPRRLWRGGWPWPASATPDLIISDLHLSGQTGLDFLKAAKSDPRIDLIPFIFLSASVDSRCDQAHGLDLDLGAIRFVLRPIDPLELVEIIETCLARAQRVLRTATILTVDDRPENRSFLTTLLAYRGHRLLEAADGAEALEVARAGRPDLIVADILMPTMDGFELVRQLRADPATAAIPVIFYTAAYQVEESHALAEAGGVVRHLAKPSDPEVILRAVDEALRPAPSDARRLRRSTTIASTCDC